MPNLEDAILLAAQAHRGQVDKAGESYILHPLRVMLSLDTEEERIAAVLHDLVEDTPYTIASLRLLGYSERVLETLEHLTRRPEESYATFIRRLSGHPLARRVKRADLQDNMDLRRLEELGERDVERMRRYLAAWRELA